MNMVGRSAPGSEAPVAPEIVTPASPSAEVEAAPRDRWKHPAGYTRVCTWLRRLLDLRATVYDRQVFDLLTCLPFCDEGDGWRGGVDQLTSLYGEHFGRGKANHAELSAALGRLEELGAIRVKPWVKMGRRGPYAAGRLIRVNTATEPTPEAAEALGLRRDSTPLSPAQGSVDQEGGHHETLSPAQSVPFAHLSPAKGSPQPRSGAPLSPAQGSVDPGEPDRRTATATSRRSEADNASIGGPSPAPGATSRQAEPSRPTPARPESRHARPDASSAPLGPASERTSTTPRPCVVASLAGAHRTPRPPHADDPRPEPAPDAWARVDALVAAVRAIPGCGDVMGSQVERLLTELAPDGEDEIRRQIAWWPHRDTTRAKHPAPLFLAFCKGRQPEPESLRVAREAEAAAVAEATAAAETRAARRHEAQLREEYSARRDEWVARHLEALGPDDRAAVEAEAKRGLGVLAPHIRPDSPVFVAQLSAVMLAKCPPPPFEEWCAAEEQQAQQAQAPSPPPGNPPRRLTVVRAPPAAEPVYVDEEPPPPVDTEWPGRTNDDAEAA